MRNSAQNTDSYRFVFVVLPLPKKNVACRCRNCPTSNECLATCRFAQNGLTVDCLKGPSSVHRVKCASTELPPWTNLSISIPKLPNGTLNEGRKCTTKVPSENCDTAKDLR